MANSDRSISGFGSSGDISRAAGSQSGSGRPSRVPENKDKFKKIVERRDERSSKDQDDDDQAIHHEASQSVFDLVAKKTAEQPVQPPVPPMSPFDLAAKADAKTQSINAEGAQDLTGYMAKPKTDNSADATVQGRSFAEVRDDLTYVNPAHLSVGDVTQSVESMAKQPMTAVDRQALIDQIVDKLYTVKSGDITDTVLTIKNPPVFAGSELVVTSYDTARGEFNIAFTNLTQEAKMLLDSQRAALMKDLETHGYVAHIIVTTTEPYVRTMAQQTEQQMAQGQQTPAETREEARKRQREEERQG